MISHNEHTKCIKNLQRNKSDSCYINVFKNFHFLNTLVAISKKSWSLNASTRDEFNIKKQEDIRQDKIYVNQFVLAYLANVLIISGAHNHRNLSLEKFTPDEMIGFCSSYYNNLSEPFLEDKNIDNYFMRLNYEQFEYNFCEAYCISRCIELYSNITNEISFDISLNKYFFDKSGLNIEKYFKIAYITYLLCQIFVPVFNKKDINNIISTYFSDITEQDVDNFLSTNSTDVLKLRMIDKSRNTNCHPGYKYKFNFLKEYPIVKVSQEKYIIPNKTIYLKQTFDIFWKFEQFIGNSFRENYFDSIFDKYTGKILKNIFNDYNVQKLTYKKKGNSSEFFDWCVIDDKNKIIYAIECKAYQLNIDNIISGDIGNQYISKFIDKPIAQMYNRSKDFYSKQYIELKFIQDYELIPICIYYDIPYASGFMHKKQILEQLNSDGLKDKLTKSHKQIQKVMSSGEINNLKQFEYYLLSISDLELLQGAVCIDNNLKNLKNVLVQMNKDNTDTNRFEKIIFDILERDIIRIPFLDNIFSDFDQGIMQKIDSKVK